MRLIDRLRLDTIEANITGLIWLTMIYTVLLLATFLFPLTTLKVALMVPYYLCFRWSFLETLRADSHLRTLRWFGISMVFLAEIIIMANVLWS